METQHLNSLRKVGIIEGISFILLLGVAMPLKYMWDMPMAVTIVGGAHGLLFMWYCIVLLFAKMERNWTLGKCALLFIASVLPFGPFVAEVHLKKEAEGSTDT